MSKIKFKKSKKSSYQRRLDQVASLDISELTMRPCYCCDRLIKSCRVEKNFDKCVKCVKVECCCDLTSLNIARWRRLKLKKSELKQKLRDVIFKRQEAQAKEREVQAREDRLLHELKYVEDEQQGLMSSELKILNEMKLILSAIPADFFSNSLIDIFSKQIALPFNDDQ